MVEVGTIRNALRSVFLGQISWTSGNIKEDDDEDVTVTAPIMTVTKTADTTTANPGDNIVYTITYTRNDPPGGYGGNKRWRGWTKEHRGLG